MLSLLLIQKIVELFFILLAGYVLVKVGVVESGDAHALSVITLFLVTPASS